MIGVLLPVLQGAASVALALVAFAVALTWPSLLPSIVAVRRDGARLAAFAGLGIVLVLAASAVYLTPGLLLRDPMGLLLSVPVVALWLLGAVALAVRGIVMDGAVRAISFAFAVVAVTGALAGVAAVVLAQYDIADRVTPTGAFVLAVGAVATVIFWARDAEPEVHPTRA